VRWRRHHLESVRCAVLLFFAIAHCVAARPQDSPARSGDKIADLKRFLPEGATITKQMTVDFANGREAAFLVIAYQMRNEEGLRILKPDKTKGWTVAYKEANPSEPVQDELILHTVRSRNGKEGLVVVYYHSGAGTTTD